MSDPRLPLLLALCGLAFTAAHAQTPPPATPPESVAPERSFGERRIERIHHEDKATSIEELRVGGETQTITVTPKGGMPAYEVRPQASSQGVARTDRGAGSSGTGGTRVWKILDF